MIIEFFGPPGAGKTTLARALVSRLRERGYAVDLPLLQQPAKLSILDVGGFGYALVRVAQAVFDVLAMGVHPTANKRAFDVAVRLVRILPPKNPVWFIRISQYILRLSKTWHRSSNIDPVLVFDQAYIQAICSLAVFNRSIDDVAFLRALNLVPQSDVAICVKIERDAQKIRLRNRVDSVPSAARFFEASQATSLQFGQVVDRLSALLVQHGRRVFVVRVEDPSSINGVIDKIEREIVEKLKSGSAVGRHEPADAAPIGALGGICDRDIQPPGFPVPSAQETLPVASAASKRRDCLAQSSIYGLLIYVGGAGLAFLVQLLIARLLHAEGYGIYSYVSAWVSLLSYGATLGFAAFVLRFTSSYRASEQWSLMSGSIRFALKRSLAAALAVSTIGLLVLRLRSGHLPREFVVSMAIGLVTVPLITLHLVGAGIVRVFGGFVAAILPERVFRDTLLLAIIGGAAWNAFGALNVEAVLAGSLVSNAAALAIVACAVFKRWPGQIKGIRPEYSPQHWWAFAFPVMAMLGLEILIMRSGVLVLGWRGEISDAGIFALGFNLAMMVQLSRAAVGIYFSPAASELHARGDRAGLQNLFARATMLSTAGAAMLAIPVLLLTHPLLRLFGKDFGNAEHIAQILVIGQFLAAAAGPQQNLLTMTGHERSAAATMLVFTALAFVGCGIAVVNHGAMGAAVATVLTFVAWNATMAIQIERRLGMKPGLTLAIAEFWAPRWGTAVVPQESDADPTTLSLP